MAALGQRGWRLPPFSSLFAAARGSKEGAGHATLSSFLVRTVAKGGASGAPPLSSSSSGGEEGFGLHSPRRRLLAAVMGDPAAGTGQRPLLFSFGLRWRNPAVQGPHSSSFLRLASEANMGGVKNGERKCVNFQAVWFPVLSATSSGAFRSLPNINHKSGFFLSGRSLSTSVAIDTNPVGERFKCQHETRGRLCKTLEKRNIWDHKRRLLANKYELRRNLYKAICRDPDLPSDMRDKFRSKLAKLPRNSAFVRVRNRCITTGRPRAVLRMFRMSRIVFREKASQGALMGVKKSSW